MTRRISIGRARSCAISVVAQDAIIHEGRAGRPFATAYLRVDITRHPSRLPTLAGRGALRNTTVEWTSADGEMIWLDGNSEMIWYDLALHGTPTTLDLGPALLVTGLPPNALVSSPDDLVFVTDLTDREFTRAANVAWSDADGTAVIPLRHEISLTGPTSIEPRDTFVVTLRLKKPVFVDLAEVAPGTVRARYQVPADAGAKGVEIHAGPDSDPANASPVGSILYADPGATVTASLSGLGSGATRHFFARSRGKYESASEWTAAQSITTA